MRRPLSPAVMDGLEALGPRHPDLVAVFASRRGRLALLLRQTMRPLAEERGLWLRETRRTVRPVMRDLRAAGFRGQCIVLQWRTAAEVAQVLHRWTCVYEGDRSRRVELTRVVDRHLEDRWFVATRSAWGGRAAPPVPSLEAPLTPPF